MCDLQKTLASVTALGIDHPVLASGTTYRRLWRACSATRRWGTRAASLALPPPIYHHPLRVWCAGEVVVVGCELADVRCRRRDGRGASQVRTVVPDPAGRGGAATSTTSGSAASSFTSVGSTAAVAACAGAGGAGAVGFALKNPKRVDLLFLAGRGSLPSISRLSAMPSLQPRPSTSD